MRKKTIKWIVIGVLCFFVTAFCTNMLVYHAVISKPENAFRQCFGFSLPDKAQIVTSKNRHPISQGKPSFAFEMILTEDQYEIMRTNLDQYAYKNDYSFREWSTEGNWDFFTIAEAENWNIDWKEPNPKEIIWFVETGYNAGFDFTKKIHLLFIMVSKEEAGTYRMYSFTT